MESSTYLSINLHRLTGCISCPALTPVVLPPSLFVLPQAAQQQLDRLTQDVQLHSQLQNEVLVDLGKAKTRLQESAYLAVVTMYWLDTTYPSCYRNNDRDVWWCTSGF